MITTIAKLRIGQRFSFIPSNWTVPLNFKKQTDAQDGHGLPTV